MLLDHPFRYEVCGKTKSFFFFVFLFRVEEKLVKCNKKKILDRGKGKERSGKMIVRDNSQIHKSVGFWSVCLIPNYEGNIPGS